MAFRKIINDSEGGQKFVTEQEEELVFDQVPTKGSFNPVTSDGVAKSLSVGAGGASIGEVVPSDTSAENPLVNEKGVQDTIDHAMSAISTGYIPRGTASVSAINALTDQQNGDMYVVSDSGTISDGNVTVNAGESVAWDAANSVWYNVNNYALRQFGTDNVKNLPTTITAFRTGDVIPVDGPSGTAKMSKDDLLKETAQNALAGNVAHEFDPNRDEDHKYLAGENVAYNGEIYAFNVDHYGAWNLNDVRRIAIDNVFALNLGAQETHASLSKYRLLDDVNKSVALKKITLSNIQGPAVARFQSGIELTSATVTISGFVNAEKAMVLGILLTGDSAGTVVLGSKRLNLYAGVNKFFEITVSGVSASKLSLFFQIPEVSNTSIIFDRCHISIDNVVTPVTSLSAFVYGSFDATVTSHDYHGLALRGDITPSEIQPYRLSDDVKNDYTLYKVVLSNVTGAIGRFKSDEAYSGVTLVRFKGFIESSVDYELTLAISTDAAGSVLFQKTVNLYAGEKKAVEIDYEIDSSDFSNLSVFAYFGRMSNAEVVFDRCYLEVDSDKIPISSLSTFVQGSFDVTVTSKNFVGLLDRTDMYPVDINAYRINNELFQQQTLYKVTLSDVDDALLRYSTGYSAESVSSVKLYGIIESNVTRDVSILLSPYANGSESVNKKIHFVSGEKKNISLDFAFNNVSVTNLSIFFNLRNQEDQVFVFDRCYLEVNGVKLPISDFGTFIYGSFEKNVQLHNFPGCVARSEIASINKLYGKRILVFGDSISDTTAINRYPYYVAELSGATQINYAVSAAGYGVNAISPHSVWGQENTKVYNMIERAHTNGVECDLVIMAAGTNDWDFNTPFGQLSDIHLESMNTPTFYWSVAKAVKNLIAYYPLATYLVIVPTPRNQPNGSGDQHTIKSHTGKTLVDYCEAIKEVCAWYSIPYLDMMQDSNLHLESDVAKAQWMPDGLHPSEWYASSKFAPMVISRFNEIL